MHYTRTGGWTIPLILLHGLIANGNCWADVASYLMLDGDVLMPDARGHGQSSSPADEYRYENHAQDVEGLINALRLAPSVVIGHSMGGMTAALLASQKKTRLRGLVLAEPAFLESKLQHQVYASDIVEQHRQWLKTPWRDYLSYLQTKHPNRSLTMLTRLARARYQTRINAFQVLRPPIPCFRQLLKEIDIPMLLVIVERSVISPETIRALTIDYQSMKIKRIKGAGHGLHYDKPKEFATIIQSFVRSIDHGV
ncbi:hydrolase [Legionella birminghamensis]|uniref:Hydrolase n=1 Tax=Legionella birminghamensis TaxID=28083 RepID=A0A378JQT7_9GAMM|nr:alpha/beta hydrolase [Legionella birminghamensis]KTC68996.1 hydrolase [Legionella birminghamensis]STX60894.1 hydrolase [Legionella birminghamensis]STX61000.1 hydrolase [Legionella birminghamensis]